MSNPQIPPFWASLLTDCHTHTPLCLHAEGNLADYMRSVSASGLAEIGFSDRNPMPGRFDEWRMALAELPEYLESVAAAHSEFPDFPVRLGLGCDYLECGESWIHETARMAEWDYLIGSVHYIHDGCAVDDPKHLSGWTTAAEVRGGFRPGIEIGPVARLHDDGAFQKPKAKISFAARVMAGAGGKGRCGKTIVAKHSLALCPGHLAC